MRQQFSEFWSCTYMSELLFGRVIETCERETQRLSKCLRQGKVLSAKAVEACKEHYSYDGLRDQAKRVGSKYPMQKYSHRWRDRYLTSTSSQSKDYYHSYYKYLSADPKYYPALFFAHSPCSPFLSGLLRYYFWHNGGRESAGSLFLISHSYSMLYQSCIDGEQQ